MALTLNGSDPSGDLGDLLDDKLAVATAVSDYLPIAGGKVLQVVRATDTTNRSTTSTANVDANISVTITPQKSTSAVLLIWAGRHSGTVARLVITDASNNAISGAEAALAASGDNFVVIAWATPATTSAVTYKGRFADNTGTGAVNLQNANNTGQMYAIEVSA